jgi:hypothetical protein
MQLDSFDSDLKYNRKYILCLNKIIVIRIQIIRYIQLATRKLWISLSEILIGKYRLKKNLWKHKLVFEKYFYKHKYTYMYIL